MVHFGDANTGHLSFAYTVSVEDDPLWIGLIGLLESFERLDHASVEVVTGLLTHFSLDHTG